MSASSSLCAFPDSALSNSIANCELSFGLAGLNNSALLSAFYPDDLPEDWHFSYYSNEFHILLINLADLGLTKLKLQRMSVSQLFAQFERLNAELSEELETEFVGVFDLSPLSPIVRQDFLSLCLANTQVLPNKLVNLTQRFSIKQTDVFECFFTPIQAQHSKRADANETCDEWLAMIAASCVLEPRILRNLLETIQAYVASQQCKKMYIIFSDNQQALSNCRNAQLLASLM